MAGIIANNLQNGQTVYGAGTSPYDATTRSVNADTETAAGQLKSLLSSGSPYLTQARSGAMQTAQSRGLLNSSMAAGAGEAAAIQAAEPIAINDANTYSTAAQQNQGYENQAGQFNAGAQNTSNLNTANAANTSMLSGQQTAQQKELAGQAAELQARTIIPAQTKAASELANQSANLQVNTLLPAQTAAQKELTAQSGQIQSGLSAQQAGQQANLLTQQGQQAQDLERLQSSNKIAQLVQSGNNDLALQTLKGSQSVQLANIEASYKDLMQTSASAAQIFNVAQKNISDILADPNTSVEQKQSAVNAQTQLLESSLAVQGGVAGIDLTSLLDFTNQPVTA